MGVAIDNTGGTGNTSDHVTSKNFAMTIGGDHLVAFMCVNGGAIIGDPTSATCGGTEMTMIGSANTASRASYLYGLLSPGSGSKTFSVTFADACNFTMRAISFTGVDQITGWGTGQTNTSASASSLTVSNISVAAGSYVIGTGGFEHATETLSSITNGTSFQEANNTYGTKNWGFGMYKVASSATESIQFNLTGTATALTGVAVGIIPKGPGGMLAFF